jgi:hypothetical protein
MASINCFSGSADFNSNYPSMPGSGDFRGMVKKPKICSITLNSGSLKEDSAYDRTIEKLIYQRSIKMA